MSNPIDQPSAPLTSTTDPDYRIRRARGPIRWAWAAAILAVGLVAAIAVQATGAIEGNFKFPFTLLVGVLTLLFLTLWVLFSGFRGRTKIAWVLAEVLPIVGFIWFAHSFLKMQGSYTGAGVPILVWKWTPPPDAKLVQSAIIHKPVSQPVDLRTTTPADWPQFLGPARTNAIADSGLSRDWQSHPPKELWRAPIGVGWGSFAIVNGFAVTQEQRGSDEITTCLEAKSGVIRWQHVNTVRFSEGMGGDGPRATPTIVDGRVYVMGATGILDCLDGSNGQPLWSRNVLSDAGAKNLVWGKSSSPLVYDHTVVVTGGETPPDVLAYDRLSGAPLWRGGADKSGYCSAALATLAGRQQVCVLNAHSAAGHDASDGHQLWTYPWPGDWPKVSQTVPFDGDRLFISAGYGVGAAMLQVTADSGSTQTVRTLWSNRKLKTQFTNIVVHEGMIFGIDDGVLECLDPADGSRKWRDGQYGHGQLLLAGDLILVQSEPGPVALVEATPKVFHELGTLPALSSKTWNNPALSGHLLLVRNDREAACFELP